MHLSVDLPLYNPQPALGGSLADSVVAAGAVVIFVAAIAPSHFAAVVIVVVNSPIQVEPLVLGVVDYLVDYLVHFLPVELAVVGLTYFNSYSCVQRTVF